MKTFDEAVKVLDENFFQKLIKNKGKISAEGKLWHANYCRCADIEDNRSLKNYHLARIKHLFSQIEFEDKQVAYQMAGAMLYEVQHAIEVGVAIGMIMEKDDAST